jgi:hypothetical protein
VTSVYPRRNSWKARGSGFGVRGSPLSRGPLTLPVCGTGRAPDAAVTQPAGVVVLAVVAVVVVGVGVLNVSGATDVPVVVLTVFTV